MDGVLIEAKDWHYEALNKALDIFGLSISRFDHLTTFDGLPTKKKLEMLTLDRGLPVQLHSFLNELKQQYTMELIHTECRPTFCHEYALSRLKNDGYKLAVASNSIRSSIGLMMQYSCLDRYLDFYLSAEDVLSGKPSPEIYTKAIQKLHLRPEECLILEDNENGKKAATASGAHLLEIDEVTDVTYQNIMQKINQIEEL